MTNHRKRGNGRGRRGGNQGRASIGGGGKDRNRELISSAVGYVYRPRSNVDDNDDFRVYGQFSSDEDSEVELTRKKYSKKKYSSAANRNNLNFIKESHPSFGSNYDDHYDNAMDRAGLGMPPSSTAAANNSNTEDRFAKGKSKYFKPILFTKSSSSLDLSKANEKIVIQKAVIQETTSTEQRVIEESMSSITMSDFVNSEDNEKELVKQDLLRILNLTNESSSSKQSESKVEVIDYADMESVTTKSKVVDYASIETISKAIKTKKVEQDNDDDEETGEEEEDILSEESNDEEVEYFYQEEDTDDDKLLEKDMLVMEEGQDLNDLLVWSAMQDSNLDPSDDNESLYDYATLDKKPTQRTLSDFEEEQAAILVEKKNFINESTRKKVGHRTQIDDAIVDPEIFGQSLKAALADVPPSLRPGMRRWYEKQQRKQDHRKKKEEAKTHKREKKKNGKGKKEEGDTNQMIKIDERIRSFIQDDSITSFQFAPMTTNVRRQIHVLATVYNLKSASIGGGGSRYTIVTKTTTTYIPNDRRYISIFLSDIQTNIYEQNKIISKNRSKGIPLKEEKKFINMNNSAPKDNKRDNKQFSHGTIVAHDAAPIGETNVGHRMLAAMGWKQGEALGSKSEGIVAPIEAIIRRKGRGLGS